MDGPIKVCSLSAALAVACRLLSFSLTTLIRMPYQIEYGMLCIFRFEAELKKQSPFFQSLPRREKHDLRAFAVPNLMKNTRGIGAVLNFVETNRSCMTDKICLRSRP
jgi:hypothetical protein